VDEQEISPIGLSWHYHVFDLEDILRQQKVSEGRELGHRERVPLRERDHIVRVV
jgi:hypothetical protein